MKPGASQYSKSSGGKHPVTRRRRGLRGVVALLAASCGLAVAASPALGEGSVDLNIGPDSGERHALSVANPSGAGVDRSPLFVYAQAGETIQLASSLMGHPGANIKVFAPGDDPETATPLIDCAASQPVSGRIASRLQEQAGPLPNAGGYDACDFAIPADGSYRVVMYGTSSTNGAGGTVGEPNVTATQGYNAAMWDVTVRDAGGVVQAGRLFSPKMQLRTNANLATASNVEAYVYTKTGYEYRVNFYQHAGANWIMTADDKGVVDATTGERTFASFACGNDQPTNNQCQYSNARPAAEFDEAGAGGTYPIFFNRVDPVAITGPGGLGQTLGFSSTPISPASNPLSTPTFTGSGGQPGGTNRGSGGTIAFTSPPAMEGLGYTLAIDTNRDGIFGNGSDFVDDTGELAATGANSYAWNGLDGQGAVPGCGDYQVQIRSSLSEVHFTQVDVENSGGTRIERLSLPTDPSLGNPLAASYDNRDPYKGGYVVTNGSPATVTDGISGPGFNGWSEGSGNTDYIDTWTRLPEVQATGTVRLLCADVEVKKSADPSPLTPGENVTFELEVTNNGPDAATNVVVTDELPTDGATFKSASAGCARAGGIVTCTLPSLAPGASHTFEVRMATDSSLDHCLENTARVRNDTPDPNLANNESERCVPIEGRSNLSIQKSPSRTKVGPGGQVMFTLVVRNEGPSDDPGVEVSDPLAAGLTLAAAKPSQGKCTTASNTLECDLGALRAGGSAQVLVTAQVSATSGCITNTARVRGARVDPSPGDNSDGAKICVEGPEPHFDLVVAKSVKPKKPLVGQTTRYRIVVRNKGPEAAPDVVLTDTLNAPVNVVSVKASAGSCSKRIPMRCELGTIAAGGKVTITVRAKHREPGCKQINAASAAAAGTDANPRDNLDRVSVCVRTVKLLLSKSVDRRQVRAGQTFGYRIEVRNPTQGEARDVRVCDRLPNGLAHVDSKPKGKFRNGQLCWTVKRLAARTAKTFLVTVRALTGASGRKVNRVTAKSADTKTARAKQTVRVVGGNMAPGGVTG